ncbi:hypothetical protein TNCT_595021 [Trichonephila clavata]|uniref:Uncharacterized protein n=1 Tax=Trichonephila clavata TaxID=2740835 RepID=A0A8X6H5I9_TRICU|nr:hypothetical protein TNCT_595021 [Trichonephila clavata]
MGKNQNNFLLLKKLIKIQKDQSDNESDAIDIDQCDNEIESEEEVNKIVFLSSEEEDLRYIAPRKKRARVIISDLKPKVIYTLSVHLIKKFQPKMLLIRLYGKH